MTRPQRIRDAIEAALDGPPTERPSSSVRIRLVSAFVPFLPATVLSPNRGERREGRIPMEISEAKRQLRADTALYLLSLDSVKAIPQPFDYARVSCVYLWHKRTSDGLYRPEDVPNAIYAHKAFFDGLIDAGLIVDDGYKHMMFGEHRIERVSDSRSEGVLVTVEEVERGE